MNNKFLGMLGLAKRAGKVQTGEDICSKAVKSGVSKLIIVACDASDNTKKSITDSCKFYKTKFVEAGSKAELGKFTGADSRAVVSVNDDNFAKAILEYNTRHESKESDTTEIQKANRKINKIEEKRLRKAAKRIWA